MTALRLVAGVLVLGVCAAMTTGFAITGWIVAGDLMWHKTRE